MKKTERDFKFDLLRIIAMLMVIIHHVVINDFGLVNVLNGTSTILSNNQIIVLIVINAFCIIGVNLFFLLSGYFKIRFSFKKLINILLQVFIVYNIVNIIGILTNHLEFTNDLLIKMLNPFDQYWFVTTYVGLFILSIVLNKAIELITLDEAKVFVVLSIILFSLYGFLFGNGLVINGGYSLIFATILYLIGGIFNKYNYKLKKNVGLFIFVICAIVNSILIYKLYKNGPLTDNIYAWNLYKYNNIFVMLQSLGLFVFFNSINMKIRNNFIIKIISLLSTNTLITYLLHSTCWLVVFRRIPVEYLLSIGKFKFGIMFLPEYALGIFVICSVIGLIYKNTLQKIINIFNK